jgi:hypothetical protein
MTTDPVLSRAASMALDMDRIASLGTVAATVIAGCMVLLTVCLVATILHALFKPKGEQAAADMQVRMAWSLGGIFSAVYIVMSVEAGTLIDIPSGLLTVFVLLWIGHMVSKVLDSQRHAAESRLEGGGEGESTSEAGETNGETRS